jgi:hypothetical protein
MLSRHHFQTLVEQAGLACCKHPVDGRLCLAIRCPRDEVRDTVARLFGAARNIEDQTDRLEMLFALASLQSEIDDNGLAVLYWPVDQG